MPTATSSPAASPQPDRHLFLGYLVLLIWLPLPLGSNRPWAWGMMEVWSLLLLIGWGWLYLREPTLSINPWRRARPAIWLFVAWLSLILLQLIPLPAGILELVSPQAAQLLRPGSATPAWQPLSVEPHATWTFLLKSISYFALFLLTLVLMNRQERVLRLLQVAVFCGVFQAVYGGVTAMSDLQSASGTFVNRNHYAGFLEICLAMGTGLLMSDLGGGEGSSWRQRLRAIIRWVASPKMGLRILLAIMVVGLVLSRSRMGNTAFFSSLLVAGGVWLTFSRTGSRRIGLFILISIVLVDIYILGHWFGFDKVVHRIQETTLQSESRDEVSIESLASWRDYLWSGSGGGSYYSIFPMYRGAETGAGYFLHAHNDYLEILVETGIPGLTLLGLLVIFSFLKAFQAIRERHRALMRGVGFAVIMGVTALMIHSSVDFNLQIPAVTAWFIVLIALGWVAADLRGVSGRQDGQSTRQTSRGGRRRHRDSVAHRPQG